MAHIGILRRQLERRGIGVGGLIVAAEARQRVAEQAEHAGIGARRRAAPPRPAAPPRRKRRVAPAAARRRCAGRPGRAPRHPLGQRRGGGPGGVAAASCAGASASRPAASSGTAATASARQGSASCGRRSSSSSTPSSAFAGGSRGRAHRLGGVERGAGTCSPRRWRASARTGAARRGRIAATAGIEPGRRHDRAPARQGEPAASSAVAASGGISRPSAPEPRARRRAAASIIARTRRPSRSGSGATARLSMGLQRAGGGSTLRQQGHRPPRARGRRWHGCRRVDLLDRSRIRPRGPGLHREAVQARRAAALPVEAFCAIAIR